MKGGVGRTERVAGKGKRGREGAGGRKVLRLGCLNCAVFLYDT